MISKNKNILFVESTANLWQKRMASSFLNETKSKKMDSISFFAKNYGSQWKIILKEITWEHDK